jgi:hypothetical protein
MPLPCRRCRSALADDQRYCLECGERQGAPRLDWKVMLAAGAVPETLAPVVFEHEIGGPSLPTPRVAAALVLGVLAFGVVLGNAAGTGASPADAGVRRTLTIIANAAPAPAALPGPVLEAAASPPATDPGTVPDGLTPSASATATSPDATARGGAGTTTDTSSSTGTPAPGDRTATTAPASTPGGGTATDPPSGPPTTARRLPPIKHVWFVALTGHSSAETFGPDSPAPYLATELRAKGTLLPWYHAAGHDPAAGGVALLGGQRDAVGPFAQDTKTLADQLTGAGRTWKAYVEGSADGLAPGDDPCRRPPEQAPRNPFLRFASITGASECGTSMAGLDRLAPDAADAEGAPSFSYILPGPAHDGSTSLADADAWLRTTLQPILDSKAYNDGGLIVVAFDGAAPQDTEAGGGRVGALLLSPFVAPGATVEAPYDPFSLLASIEQLFGLEPLGYAKDTKLKAFGPKVFAAWSPDAAAGS